MGILADSAEDDVRALEWVFTETVRAWKLHCAEHPQEQVRIEVNPDLIAHVSWAGGLIFERRFPEPTLIDRLAALLVVATCSPLFQIKRGGHFVTNFEHRRIIIGIFGLAIVRTALRLCTPNEGTGCYAFSGVKDMGRFLSFCECLDAVEITNIASSPGPPAAAIDHAYNVLAKDIIGVTLFIERGIEFVAGSSDAGDCMDFPDSPILPPTV